METYLRFVDKYSKLILAALLAVTVFFFGTLAELTADSNPYLLSEDHPARKSILDMQKEFTGTFDAVLIALYNKSGVFNPTTLEAVRALTEESRKVMLANESDATYLKYLADKYGASGPELKALAEEILKGGLEQNDYFAAEKLLPAGQTLGLGPAEKAFLGYLPRRLNPIKELAGMAATENMVVRDGSLVIRPSLRDKSMSPEAVRGEIVNNELMLNGVVSKDEKVALVTVELFVKQDDADGQLRAYEAFSKIVDDYKKAHPELKDEVHIAGVPIFIAEQKKLVDRDMGTLLPIVILVVGTILIAFFRKPLGFLLPMLNVVICTIWTLGLMAIFRVPLDLVTSILPVFLITICGADAIHLMYEYYSQKNEGRENKDALKRTMRVMVSPVILTTITTVAGFLLSTSTNISSIRAFGIFMSVGLVVAQIISLLLIPAWINLMGSKKIVKVDERKRRELLGPALERLFRKLIAHRKPVLIGFGAALVVAAYLALNINVEDAGAEYFAEGNPFRVSDEFVNEHVAGTSPGWVSVEGRSPRAILTVENMEFIDKLDKFLVSQKNVTYSYSVAKYVKRMNLVMHDMDPSYNRIPAKVEKVRSTDPGTGAQVEEDVSGDELVSQSILMFENGGGTDLTNVLNRDFSKAATMFTMNSTRATDYKRLLAILDSWLAKNTPPGLHVKVGGTPVIWSGVLDEIIKGQLTSIIFALGAVAIVLMLWLRSARLGILASLPLAGTLVFYYGTMSALGIDLNIGTALISFLVVGIVDYSVHYLHRVNEQLAAGDNLDDALIYAIRHSGRSIVFNVLLFSLGFLTLLASEFTPIVHLGALVALALSLSGFMSLFLIAMLAPAFIRPREVEVMTVEARA